ncbi:DUF3012 domain-containing protein [Cellvibrio sp. ARAG 10.3]|uniref:DUF3012 domain-containing protein n=1 Tax=Cellvibrio sp. ARAG 10.3 TaxID=3451358 RepID=UPI003F47BA28
MPSKLTTILQGNKLLFVVFGLSVLMLIVGAMLIARTSDISPEPAPTPANQDDDLSLIQSLDDTEDIINNASRNGVNPLPDDTRLVRGSEAWCESMMAKADTDWNDADTRLFAQKCLND